MACEDVQCWICGVKFNAIDNVSVNDVWMIHVGHTHFHMYHFLIAPKCLIWLSGLCWLGFSKGILMEAGCKCA